MRELRRGTALPRFLECFRPAAALLFHRTMRRYQDFKAWQLARELHRKVIAMTSTGPASRDFKFRDNLRDAADSAQRNFPEGFGRFAPADFAHFLDHSRASLLEVKNGIGAGYDRRHFQELDCLEADALASRALKALSGLQQYLRSPEAKRNADQARARHIARRARRQQTTQKPDEPDEQDEPTNPRTRRTCRTPRTNEPPRT